MKPRNIFVSFSGGKTSAYMAKQLLESNPNDNYLFIFSNTGQEHEETYKFIDRVRNWLNIKLWIVEAVIKEGKGTNYKIVKFEDMKRDGSLFESLVEKYGIPNTGYPHCTRELKIMPMHKFAKQYFNGEDYYTALGIRSDESDRVSSKYEELRYLYPLAWNGTTKEMVNDFWAAQEFNLDIPEHLGNCVWCWKKSFSKHAKIIGENEEYYAVPKMLEEKFKINEISTQARQGSVQTFFRTKKSYEDLKADFDKNAMEELQQDDLFDNYINSCKESCGIT